MQQQKTSPKRTSRTSWVPSEVKPARAMPVARLGATESSDASQWVPATVRRSTRRNGRSNGNGATNGHAAEEPAQPRPAPKRRKLPKRASPKERWFILRLRRAKRRLDERDEEIERLRERIGELEANLADRPEPETKPKREPRRPAPSKARRRNGRLDLNHASFEQLRTLGLTVTQTSRLIAYRDTSGGFNSFGEIEELPGFGKATLALLRSRTRTNGS